MLWSGVSASFDRRPALAARSRSSHLCIVVHEALRPWHARRFESRPLDVECSCPGLLNSARKVG